MHIQTIFIHIFLHNILALNIILVNSLIIEYLLIVGGGPKPGISKFSENSFFVHLA